METNFFKKILDKNNIVAAPMAGITIPPFRRLLRDFTDGLVYSEMVSVEGLSRNSNATFDYMERMPGDSPLVLQLFGGNYDAYPRAAEIAEEKFEFSAFDINMGCPVKKVVKAGGGCALIKDLDRVGKIISNLRKSTSKPFSIKTRLGWDNDSLTYKDMIHIAESNGANAIAIHARTRNQMFSGKADYQSLTEAVKESEIPVMGSGDVVDLKSYKAMLSTGVAGVMIGRGMLHQPWILKSLREGFDPEQYIDKIQIYDIIKKFSDLAREHAGDNEKKANQYLNVVKKFAVWFSKGLDDSAAFRAGIFSCKTYDELIESMEYYRL